MGLIISPLYSVLSYFSCLISWEQYKLSPIVMGSSDLVKCVGLTPLGVSLYSA